MPLRDMALGVLVAVLWGLNFVAIKIGVQEVPPLALTVVRFALTAALIVPFTRMTRQALPWVILLSFTLGTMHFALLFYGMNGVGGGTAAILIQLGVPFSTILAAIFLKDHLGGWRIFGLGLAFGGAAVLAGEPTLPALGPFLVLVLSAFSWAASNLLIKRVSSVTPLAISGWMALFATPQIALWSFLLEHNQVDAVLNASWHLWASMTYIILGSSVIAYTLWYRLLSLYPVSQVVPLNLLSPLVGIAASIAFLGESLTWERVLGGFLTIGGVGLIIYRQSLPRANHKTPPASELERGSWE